MALKLDLTGLFAAAEDERGLTRAAFEAALPRATEARAQHLADVPKWRTLHDRVELLADCPARAAQVLDSGADAFVVLGIGGSALGNAALMAALAPIYQEWRPTEGRPRVFVPDSVDPDWIGELLEAVPPERCHFNVISKSGGTIETSSQFLVAYEAVRRALGGDDEATRARFTITTDPETGHFRKLCDDLGFVTLPVPEGVGGRFSVLSPVGMFMAEVAGVDTESLMAGAAKTDANLAHADASEDAALAYALAHVLHMERGRSVHVHFPYAHRLRLLGDWYQQLWAESLGKKHDTSGNVVHVGPTPVKAVGPTDQHSQCQLYIEGPDDKVFTMVKLGKFGREVEVGEPFASSAAFDHLGHRKLSDLMEAERQGTEVALQDAGRPICTVELCQLDAFHVGQYFLFFEVATAYAGHLLGIDPYDQPGVENGKKAALALMGCAGFEELAERIRASRDGLERIELSC